MAKTTEHFTPEVIEAFFAKRLCGDEEAAILFHIDDCVTCDEIFRRASNDDELKRGTGPDKIINEVFRSDHPKYKEVVAYVQGGLNAHKRRTVQGHLEDCAQCRLDVAGLQTSKHEAGDVRKHSGTNIGTRWKSITQRVTVPLGVTACVCVLIILAVSVPTGLNIWRVRIFPQTNNLTNSIKSDTTNPNLTSENLYSASASPSMSGEHGERQTRATLPRKDAGNEGATTRKTRELRPHRQPVNEVISDNGRGFSINDRNELEGHHDLPASLRRDIARALAGRITVTSLPLALSVPSEVITRSVEMDEEKNVRPVKLKHPINTKVLEDTLELGWHPLEEADGYQVMVADENSIKVWSSPIVTETSWRVMLPRHEHQPKLYRWKVIPYRDGRRLKTPFDPGANFEIVSLEKHASLMGAKQYSSHLALGVLYAKEGLHERAECELTQLQKKNPRSKLIRKLLRQVRLNKQPYSLELRCSQ